MCMLPLHLSQEDLETNLHCVISNNVENIRSSFHCVWCCDNGIESALVKLPGSVRKSRLSCKQHPFLPWITGCAVGKNPASHHTSLSCVWYWGTQVFWASLSTICKKGNKSDETVSQINVVMVGIDSLLTFGENGHAQPHLTVLMAALYLCSAWRFPLQFHNYSVGWEAALAAGESNSNRAVCGCY